jgi:hypothetical protein
MAWTFYLTITNATDHELEVASSSLEWGYWYRDSVNNRGPCSVPAKGTVQALGIRAASGTWTGYECHAQWKDKVKEGQKSYGAITLMIDVPFSGSNNSSLTPAGAIKVTGWSNLPSGGHDFSRSITVSAGPTGQLEVSESVAADVAGADPVEVDYRDYLLAVAAANPDIRDWAALSSKLSVVEEFNPFEFLPKNPSLTPKLLARSEPAVTERALWAGVGDPDYPNPYAQELFVEGYFSAAIYSVSTNPRNIISLPAGSELKISERVTMTSAIKNVLTTTWSLKTSLSDKATDPITGSEVAYAMDMEMGVSNVLEESREHVTEKIVEQTFKAPEAADLVIVPWVFATAVGLYRRDIKGKVALIAVSEWAEAQIFRSYTAPVTLDDLVAV